VGAVLFTFLLCGSSSLLELEVLVSGPSSFFLRRPGLSGDGFTGCRKYLGLIGLFFEGNRRREPDTGPGGGNGVTEESARISIGWFLMFVGIGAARWSCTDLELACFFPCFEPLALNEPVSSKGTHCCPPFWASEALLLACEATIFFLVNSWSIWPRDFCKAILPPHTGF